MRGRRMRALLLLGVWLAAVMPLAVATPAADAAAIEWSAATKTAWDKTVAGTDSASAVKMKGQYASLQTMKNQEAQWEAKLASQHVANADELAATRKRISQLNAAQLRELEAKVKTAKAKYQPLFDQYKRLNQQIGVARTVGAKNVRAALQLQADLLKPLVAAAKEAIKKQETAYKTAKDNTAKLAKSIRATLADIEPIKVRIAAEKKAAASSKSAMTPLSQNLNLAVKKNDAKAAAGALGGILDLYRLLNGHKEKNYNYETSIAAIIAKAKKQLPAA